MMDPPPRARAAPVPEPTMPASIPSPRRMKIAPPLIALTAGVVLVILGLNASDSLSSALGEMITGSPSEKSLLLIISGTVLLLYGGVGTIFSSRR